MPIGPAAKDRTTAKTTKTRIHEDEGDEAVDPTAMDTTAATATDTTAAGMAAAN